MKRLILFWIITTLLPLAVSAEKVLALMPGIIYLSNGEVSEVCGSKRVAIPFKHRDLLVLDQAYTHNQKIGRRINPADVDSVVMWNVSSPDYRHTIRYLKDLGWCWQREKAPGLTLYAFCPKGYFIAGNGGMWCRGKNVAIVDKDGTLHRFPKTDKKSNDSFRRQVAALVEDDPELAQKILSSRLRRDKTLRMLALYEPCK